MAALGVQGRVLAVQGRVLAVARAWAENVLRTPIAHAASFAWPTIKIATWGAAANAPARTVLQIFAVTSSVN